MWKARKQKKNKVGGLTSVDFKRCYKVVNSNQDNVIFTYRKLYRSMEQDRVQKESHMYIVS